MTVAAPEVVVVGGTIEVGDAGAVVVVGDAIIACIKGGKVKRFFCFPVCGVDKGFSCLPIRGVEVILRR